MVFSVAVGTHLGGEGGLRSEAGHRERIAVGGDEVGCIVVEYNLPCGGSACLSPAQINRVSGNIACGKVFGLRAGRRQVEVEVIHVEVIGIVGVIINGHILGTGREYFFNQSPISVRSGSKFLDPGKSTGFVGGGGITYTEHFTSVRISFVVERKLGAICGIQFRRNEVLVVVGSTVIRRETETVSASMGLVCIDARCVGGVNHRPAVQLVGILKAVGIRQVECLAGGEEALGTTPGAREAIAAIGLHSHGVVRGRLNS